MDTQNYKEKVLTPFNAILDILDLPPNYINSSEMYLAIGAQNISDIYGNIDLKCIKHTIKNHINIYKNNDLKIKL